MAAFPVIIAVSTFTVSYYGRNIEEGIGATTPELLDEDDGVVHVAKLVRHASIQYQKQEAEKARTLTDQQREALQREKEKRADEVIEAMLEISMLD